MQTASDAVNTHARPVPEADVFRPLLSVIVPAYNSARTIGRCLEAFALQRTRHRFEVLVVHSGDDDTCERARHALPGVRTVQLSERAIPARARNIGVQQSRGDFLAFVDSDIYVDPTWVDHAVEAAQSGYDLVCGSIENANPRSKVSRAEQLLMFKEFLPDQPERPTWFALSGNTVLSRTSYLRFGPFAELRAAEDVVFSRKLIAAGGRILFYPALRVRHDNRTQVRPFLRNQLMVGKHTAVARRVVPFVDSRSYALFLMSLPIAPLVKLGKVAIHVCRYDRGQMRRVWEELPLLCLGSCAYSIGLCLGAIAVLASRSSTAATLSNY